MTKSFIRALLALAAATLASTAALPAAAATLTYSDPNCAGFQITGGGGSFTLTCAKLQCSIAGNTAPNTATNPTLTATCTPTPATYLWTLLTGPFSDPTCNSPQSPSSNQTIIPRPTGIAAGQTRACLYQVTGTAAPLSGQAMVTVTWSDAPPSPPVCNPLTSTTNPSPLIAGQTGTVTVNSSCTAGSAITYTWTRTAAPGNAGTFTPSGGASQGDNLAANAGVSGVTYTYQLQACTAPGACASTQSLSVIMPGTGGGGAADCTAQGFAKTIFIDIPFGTTTPAQFLTANYGTGLSQNTALVIRLGAAPAGTVALGSAGHVTEAEFGDPQTLRTAAISTNACDWTNTVGSPYYVQPDSSTSDWSLKVNATASFGYHTATLAAGTDYYINIKLFNSLGQPTCFTSTCNMVVNWIRPN